MSLRKGADALAISTKGRVTSFLGETIVGNSIKLKNDTKDVKLKR